MGKYGKTWVREQDNGGNMAYARLNIPIFREGNWMEKAWNKVLHEDMSNHFSFYRILLWQFKGENLFLGYTENTLNESQNANEKSDISIDEIATSEESMKNNNSPWLDGISAEFYKSYWNHLKSNLIKIWTKGLHGKELACSQYHTMITFLCKTGSREVIFDGYLP